MKIKSFKIRGYRTIKDEIELSFHKKMATVVGPNNCGKTNLLRAIQLFFTGYDNKLGYSHLEDFSRGQKSLQTSVQMVVEGIDQEADPETYSTLEQILELLKVSHNISEPLTLYLTFSALSNPSYRVFPTNKRPKGNEAATYSRLERKLFESIFEKISVHYIPSEKTVPQIYESLIQPFLIREVHEVMRSKVAEMSAALNSVAEGVTEMLDEAGVPGFQIGFDLPSDPLKIFGSIDFTIEDNNKTLATEKGMGIQSIALLSSIYWISEKERSEGKIPLWLVEEPEAFLHPELIRQSAAIVRKVASESNLVVTTHSLGFVPSDPEEVIGLSLKGGWSQKHKFSTYNEATSHIRSALGVKFSDFYNLSKANIFVEGKTDRAYLEYLFDFVKSAPETAERFPTLLSDDTSIHDFDGTKGLEGFLRATYAFISKEVKSVTLFDGDAAGDAARRALVSYFGNKNYQFSPNRDYVIVKDRFAIEGLAPVEFLSELSDAHPNWFEGFGFDSQGGLLPFKVKDGNKVQFFNSFKRYTQETDIDWSVNYIRLLEALEAALSNK